MSDLFSTMQVSSAGMRVQSERINVIAQNAANADTAPSKPGEKPYTRKTVSFKNVLDKTTGQKLVTVDKVNEDKKSEYVKKYMPGNPAADADGYVQMPNVSTIIEMMDMKEASKSYEANMGMHYCDVLLAVGARFDDRVIGSPAHFASEPRKIIHIDIDPSSISKRVKVDVPIVGDVGEVLGELLALLEGASEKPDQESLGNWWKQIEEWRRRDCLKFSQGDGLIKPQYVIQKLWEVTGGDAFVTSDVGQHQMWGAQYYKFDKPRRWINSGGLGTMGFGLPAAMGVQLAHPGSPVACVTGEASIQMNIQELATCKQFRLPIKVVMLNNRYLGMVRQWQEIFHGNRYSESYMDSLPDFSRLAEAYGHVGIRIDKPGDVEGALRDAFSRKNDLVFLDFQVDQTENVYPMVQGGKGLTDMILSAEDL